MLDDIVGRVVHDHLDNLDLSGVTRNRVDETSAKERHRYITVVTDVDTGKIVFITKGKDSKTMEEFACWLSAHGGNPKDIVLMASDSGIPSSRERGNISPMPGTSTILTSGTIGQSETGQGPFEGTGQRSEVEEHKVCPC